jgi:hypothetical protein
MESAERSHLSNKRAHHLWPRFLRDRPSSIPQLQLEARMGIASGTENDSLSMLGFRNKATMASFELTKRYRRNTRGRPGSNVVH